MLIHSESSVLKGTSHASKALAELSNDAVAILDGSWMLSLCPEGCAVTGKTSPPKFDCTG